MGIQTCPIIDLANIKGAISSIKPSPPTSSTLPPPLDLQHGFGAPLEDVQRCCNVWLTPQEHTAIPTVHGRHQCHGNCIALRLRAVISRHVHEDSGSISFNKHNCYYKWSSAKIYQLFLLKSVQPRGSSPGHCREQCQKHCSHNAFIVYIRASCPPNNSCTNVVPGSPERLSSCLDHIQRFPWGVGVPELYRRVMATSSELVIQQVTPV